MASDCHRPYPPGDASALTPPETEAKDRPPPPLGRSDTLDAYSSAAAAADGEAHDAHKYYRDTGAGGGLVLAENEIPWWSLASFGSVHVIIQKGLAMQWAEGPGGGHYDNMTGPYTQMGCGVASINGEITVTQDFR